MLGLNAKFEKATLRVAFSISVTATLAQAKHLKLTIPNKKAPGFTQVLSQPNQAGLSSIEPSRSLQIHVQLNAAQRAAVACSAAAVAHTAQ